MFITRKSLFFSLLFCGFLTSGCEVDRPNQQQIETITVSGLAYYDTTPVSNAQVLFVATDNTELFFTTFTDESGRFSLSLETAGEYEIYIGRATEGGYFDKQYAVTISSDATTYNLGEIEVEFYPMGSDDIEIEQMYELEYNDDEFATVEGALVVPQCVINVLKQALKYSDPLNHCYAACQIKRSCGVSASGTVLLSYAKEACDIIGWQGFCHDFSWGDLWADFKGLTCSYKVWQTCYSCCPK